MPNKRQEAIELLKQACGLAPQTGFEKFMYLGQVLDACGRAREAEAAMRAGVEILKNENDAANSNGEFLTSALCSLAELLMGMIHDDDDMMDACYASESALPELGEVEALLEQATAMRALGMEMDPTLVAPPVAPPEETGLLVVLRSWEALEGRLVAASRESA